MTMMFIVGVLVGIVVTAPTVLIYAIVKTSKDDGEKEKVLEYLREHSPKRYDLMQLARELGMKHRRVGAIICRLEELRLVEREANPLRFHFPWRRL